MRLFGFGDNDGYRWNSRCVHLTEYLQATDDMIGVCDEQSN